MKRTIKISIQDFESIQDLTCQVIFREYNNTISFISDNLYLTYKDYLKKLNTQEYFTFEVSPEMVDIFNFIHLIDLRTEIQKLSEIERFLLIIYVVNTYGNSENKETEELIINLGELETEIDEILKKEENFSELDPILEQILEISSGEYPSNQIKHIIDFKDIYLTYGDQIIPELSREEAIIKLRENKLNELFKTESQYNSKS